MKRLSCKRQVSTLYALPTAHLTKNLQWYKNNVARSMQPKELCFSLNRATQCHLRLWCYQRRSQVLYLGGSRAPKARGLRRRRRRGEGWVGSPSNWGTTAPMAPSLATPMDAMAPQADLCISNLIVDSRLAVLYTSFAFRWLAADCAGGACAVHYVMR